MKKALILLGIFFLLLFSVNAESWLLIDSTTKEVKSLSPEDDAQLEPGWEKIILDEDFGDIVLSHHPTYYKYIDGKFITNNAKLDAEYQAKLKAEEIAQETEMIDKKMRELSISELKKEGKTFKHYKDTGELKKED